jgi:WD40 repeat protein
MNTETRKQKYYGVYGEDTNDTSYDNYHRGPIMSLDYQKDKKLVATGSMGLNPEVCIWDAETLKLVTKFHQGKKTKAVGIVKFFF